MLYLHAQHKSCCLLLIRTFASFLFLCSFTYRVRLTADRILSFKFKLPFDCNYSVWVYEWDTDEWPALGLSEWQVIKNTICLTWCDVYWIIKILSIVMAASLYYLLLEFKWQQSDFHVKRCFLFLSCTPKSKRIQIFDIMEHSSNEILNDFRKKGSFMLGSMTHYKPLYHCNQSPDMKIIVLHIQCHFPSQAWCFRRAYSAEVHSLERN